MGKTHGGGHGFLTVLKEVFGATAGSWGFTLTLSSAYTASNRAVYSLDRGEATVDFVDGICEFTLGYGETVTIYGLPEVEYSIRETDKGESDSTFWYDETGEVAPVTPHDNEDVGVSGTISPDGGEIKCVNSYRQSFPINA